jgi:hypothetical protein
MIDAVRRRKVFRVSVCRFGGARIPRQYVFRELPLNKTARLACLFEMLGKDLSDGKTAGKL